MESTDISHVDGIPWFDAKLPPRLHFCKPQTTGWLELVTKVDRCACGGVRRDNGPWFDKNERRKRF